MSQLYFHLNKFLLVLILTIVFSCNNNTKKHKKEKHLIGKINFEDLNVTPYSNWFDTKYSVKDSIASFIDTSGYKIKIFMGTWCGDSKEQVPKFYNIINKIGLNLEKVELFAVGYESDEYKMSKTKEDNIQNIFKVPTFIFLDNNNKEIGRIIEKPVISLEKDFFDIIYRTKYKPNYYQTHNLAVKLNNNDIKTIDELFFKNDSIINLYQESGLISLGKKLFISQEYIKSAIVFEIGVIKNSKNFYFHKMLGKSYIKIGDLNKSINALKKALEIKPENNEIKKLIKKLTNENISMYK